MDASGSESSMETCGMNGGGIQHDQIGDDKYYYDDYDNDYEPCCLPYTTSSTDDEDMDSDDYIDADDVEEYYRDSRCYGPDDEEKTVICSSGSNFSWKEPSSGTSWIGVYGIGGTCAISMDMYPNQDALKRPICHLDSTKILHIAVSDMKDESSEIRQELIGHSTTGSEAVPFAVVSIAPDARPVPLEINIEGAINFLEKKLKGCRFLTDDETEQITVCSVKYLFGSMCKSSDIKIWCFGDRWQTWSLTPSQIEDHWNAIDWTTTTSFSICTSFSGIEIK